MMFLPETWLKFAALLMPKNRTDWLRAMTIELQAIADPKARKSFAFGCFTSAGLAWCQSRKGLSYMARGGGALLLVGGSAYGILASGHFVADPETAFLAKIVTGLCLIYMVAGGLLLASLRALKIFAFAGAFAASLTWVWLMTMSPVVSDLPTRYLTAITVEVTGIMTCLAAAAIYLGWLYKPEAEEG